MSDLRPSDRLDVVDIRDNPRDDEDLEVVRLLLDAAIKRIDRLLLSSADLRHGERAAGTLAARQHLQRAIVALDGGDE
jgi:hypothetical protein